MNLNENLLRSFAKAVNAPNRKETKLYYGTITKVEETDGVRVPYVHLDGSEPGSETPLVEGTEVRVDDRVIVTIENHKAVVMSNITSPASARTASNYMDLVEEEEDTEHGYEALSGLKIGDMLDDEHDFNVLITANGVYIRDGRKVLSHYTGDGINFGTWNDEDNNPCTAILRAGMLELYRNFQGYDDYDAMLRLQPGYIEGENSSGKHFEILPNQMHLEGFYNAELGGGTYGLGDCITSATYTNSGGDILFTIPLPFNLNSSINKLTCLAVVRCNGNYLIQESSSGGHSAPLDTSVTANAVYSYNGSENVAINVAFSVVSVGATGITCKISGLTNNGLNNYAAVAYLYSIEITFA